MLPTPTSRISVPLRSPSATRTTRPKSAERADRPPSRGSHRRSERLPGVAPQSPADRRIRAGFRDKASKLSASAADKSTLPQSGAAACCHPSLGPRQLSGLEADDLDWSLIARTQPPRDASGTGSGGPSREPLASVVQPSTALALGNFARDSCQPSRDVGELDEFEEGDEDFALQKVICQSLMEAQEQEWKRLEQEAQELKRSQELKLQEDEAAERRRGPMPPSSDLARTFEPSRWLNDASIAFIYSVHAAGDLGLPPEDSRHFPQGGSQVLPECVLLLDPATTFWLMMEEDPNDLEEARRALKLHQRDLILCPINDSRDRGHADTGTHWSLLVCWRRGSHSDCLSFAYYDSLASHKRSGNGFQRAEALASRIADESEVYVSAGACARQTNGWDCGVYVLLFSEIIVNSFVRMSCESLSAVEKTMWEARLLAITPRQVSDRRRRYCRKCMAAAVATAA